MKKIWVFCLLCLAFVGESKAQSVYSIGTDGHLYSTNMWDGLPSQKVGTNWGHFKHVFTVGGGIIYAVDNGGRLLWYEHLGVKEKTEKWNGGQEVASGWGNFTHIIPIITTGIIFAIDTSGNLYRYNHTGWVTGAATWEDWNPPPIGNGWGGFTKVFSGGNGYSLYGINANGDVLHYQFSETGALLSGPTRVGEGWGGFTEVWGGIWLSATTPEKIYFYKYSNQLAGIAPYEPKPWITNVYPNQTRWFGAGSDTQIDRTPPPPPPPPTYLLGHV
jgi:hypothetical protein